MKGPSADTGSSRVEGGLGTGDPAVSPGERAPLPATPLGPVLDETWVASLRRKFIEEHSRAAMRLFFRAFVVRLRRRARESLVGNGGPAGAMAGRLLELSGYGEPSGHSASLRGLALAICSGVAASTYPSHHRCGASLARSLSLSRTRRRRCRSSPPEPSSRNQAICSS